MDSSSKTEWTTNYASKKSGKDINYDYLANNILQDKQTTISFLQEHKIIRNSPLCQTCGKPMKIEAVTGANATSDGLR